MTYIYDVTHVKNFNLLINEKVSKLLNQSRENLRS